MKKLYFFVLATMFAIVTVNAEKILIVGVESTNASFDAHMVVIQMIADEIAKIDGFTTEIKNADEVVAEGFDFSSYDAIVITEAAGSSRIATIGTYTDAVVKAKPVLNMKMYAIHDGKNGWNWIPSSDFFGSVTDWDSTKVAEQAVMKISTAHEIFGNKFSVNQEIQLFAKVWKAGAHFQTGTFENSAVADIKSNTTAIGTSTFIASNSQTSPASMMFAIEENASSKRNVIWGVHNQFIEPTDDYKLILKNSVLWILKKAITSSIDKNRSDLGLNIYPNPANRNITADFTVSGNQPVNISIFDITGKLVLSTSKIYYSGPQTQKINISGLSKGLYILKVDLNQSTVIQKLTIN